MHVGEPVAMVVATSAAAAQDAADKIVVDYEPLTPVTDARAAGDAGRAAALAGSAGNIGFDWTAPADPDGKKQAALDRAFKEAAHVVRVELVNQRLVVASLEPRTATRELTMPPASSSPCASARKASPACAGRCAGAMNIKPEELRVLTDDVGGAFGMKGWSYPEYVALLHARAHARQADPLGFDALGSLSSPTIRAAIHSGPSSLRSTPRGRFLGLRVDCLGNLGAYFTGVAHFCLDDAHLRLPADGL